MQFAQQNMTQLIRPYTHKEKLKNKGKITTTPIQYFIIIIIENTLITLLMNYFVKFVIHMCRIHLNIAVSAIDVWTDLITIADG